MRVGGRLNEAVGLRRAVIVFREVGHLAVCDRSNCSVVLTTLHGTLALVTDTC